MLERWFELRAHNTNVSTETLAGLTTFMTMSYIIIVQPAILSSAGMDFGAVMMATCISAAVSTLIMGFWANYPVALAPAMGENIFFAYTIVLGMGVAWQNALGMVLLSGLLFIVLSLFRVRELVLDAMPLGLRRAIAAGIGAFILVLGLQHAGVLVRHHEIWQKLFSAKNAWQALSHGEWSFAADLTCVYGFGSSWSSAQLVAGVGLAVMVLLMLLRRRAALLTGMVAAVALALILGLITWQGLTSAPPDISPTLWKFDLRTGLTAVVCALLFLAAMFFSPLVQMIGSGVPAGEGITLYPVTAAALMVVGVLMLKSLKGMDWKKWDTSVPAILIVIGIPLSYSIADGLAFGFISFPAFKILAGRAREVSWLIYLLGIIFILRYIFL